MDISLFLRLESHISSGMSEFQMTNFVINDNITPYRKLRQAVIEAKARLENITYFGFDLEELNLKKQKSMNFYMSDDDFQTQMNDIETRRLSFEIDRKTALLKQMQTEALFFLSTVKTIVDIDFGGEHAILSKIADPVFIEHEEANFWTKKLARSVFSDYVNYGTVSKGVLESIACLSDSQRKTILSQATDQHMDFNVMLHKLTDELLVTKD